MLRKEPSMCIFLTNLTGWRKHRTVNGGNWNRREFSKEKIGKRRKKKEKKKYISHVTSSFFLGSDKGFLKSGESPKGE